MKQLSLFEFEQVATMRVCVYPDGRGHYYATLAGGWWMAYGDTPKKAVDAVIARYEAER